MTPQQLIEDAKNSSQFKYKYRNLSDFDIYEDLKKQYPDIKFPKYNPPKIKSTSLKARVIISPVFITLLLYDISYVNL